MRLRARFEFVWRDLWLGLYLPKPKRGGPWTHRHIYLCIVPTLPLHIEITSRSRGGKTENEVAP